MNLKVVVALACLVMSTGCKKLEAVRIAYTQVLPAGDQLLLVGSVPKKLTGYRGFNRIALVGMDGVLRKAVDDRSPMHVAGVTEDVVWISSGMAPPGLQARALDTLAPKPGITEAIAGHDALAATFEVLGMFEGQAAVEGPDSKKYRVDVSGNISALPDDAQVIPAPRETTMPRNEGAFGEDSTDALVFGHEYKAGFPVPTLSRVDGGDTPKWTKTATELAAPVGVEEATTDVVGHVEIGGDLWVVFRSEAHTRFQQKDYYEVEHRLVKLDPETGNAVESHVVEDR